MVHSNILKKMAPSARAAFAVALFFSCQTTQAADLITVPVEAGLYAAQQIQQAVPGVADLGQLAGVALPQGLTTLPSGGASLTQGLSRVVPFPGFGWWLGSRSEGENPVGDVALGANDLLAAVQQIAPALSVDEGMRIVSMLTGDGTFDVTAVQQMVQDAVSRIPGATAMSDVDALGVANALSNLPRIASAELPNVLAQAQDLPAAIAAAPQQLAEGARAFLAPAGN